MLNRRVVVTGLGLVCPIGNEVESGWKNVLDGQSGATPIECFDASQFAVQFSSPVKNFEVEQYLSKKDLRKMDTFIHYGMAAGIQAFNDSGLVINDALAERCGCSIGSGIGGLPYIEAQHTALTKGGPRKITPFFVPASIINMISGNLSIRLGLRGPNLALVTACTTGTHSIGEAGRLIAYGDVDVMLAGGAEMATSPLGIGGFAASRALSTRNDNPQAASRPFDRGRDGFVLGDGAGVLVLEEYEHAKRRGARIYAELAGYGMSGDAHHMTQPPEDGHGARRAMQAALRDAQLNPEQVDHINAHATSTPAGDIAETKAIHGALGAHAARPAVSATKSMTGHLLGAAGGVEAVFTVLALRDQVAPPTINLDDPDPDCALNHVAWQAREMRIEVALSNSFGFGGTNGSLVFCRSVH